MNRHSVASVGPGRHVIRRGPDEIGMVTFCVPITREATVLRVLCEALDGPTPVVVDL